MNFYVELIKKLPQLRRQTQGTTETLAPSLLAARCFRAVEIVDQCKNQVVKYNPVLQNETKTLRDNATPIPTSCQTLILCDDTIFPQKVKRFEGFTAACYRILVSPSN